MQPILLTNPARRRFIKNIAAMSMCPYWINTQAAPANSLSGTEFHLIIAKTWVNFSGKPQLATTVNGTIPAPTLYWREGDTVTLRVTNQLNETTSIHWHGLILPDTMDGAQGVNFAGIAANTSFIYQFTLKQAGTYWYHSHSGMQEQTGLYGAIVISPLMASHSVSRDYVIVLSDWTDDNPYNVLANLKKDSSYYNFQQLTARDFIADVAQGGWQTTLDNQQMWQEMRMNKTDLSDISAYTYHYLLNGATAQNPWTGLFTQGETIRLRFINAAAQSFFDIRIPNLTMTVIQADGQLVEPVEVDEFRLGSAENYDVLITPSAAAYCIFAQSLDRTGFALATLTTRLGVSAPTPALDKPQPLAMLDMMGDMSSEQPSHHASSEFGASVDMRVDTPRDNLDDAGVGLRDNGRRVLTYADLKTIGGALDSRPAERELELHLTGNMARYSWSFDGLSVAESTPIHLRYGERLRVILVNDTMMLHPIHLHGMWSELENADGTFQVRKHTLIVQPAQRLRFLVTADAKGYWPLHCHLFYHMHAGMFRVVVVS